MDITYSVKLRFMILNNNHNTLATMSNSRPTTGYQPELLLHELPVLMPKNISKSPAYVPKIFRVINKMLEP